MVQKSLYFEVSTEVITKVGGIHTVLRSKAHTMTNDMKNDYFMVGKYNHVTVSTDVEITDCSHPAIRKAINALQNQGIGVYFGKWLIRGSPQVVLFDLGSAYYCIDGWRNDLQNLAGIWVPPYEQEGSDALVFGALVAWFLYEVKENTDSETSILAHFHEWLSGVGLILLRKRFHNIALIFTTHATLMGRHLSAASVDLYNNMHSFNMDKESGDRKIYHKYCIERSAAHCAHVFTTVSQITAEESEVFLGRKPEVITPNGLNVQKYTASHEHQNMHEFAKRKIQNFVSGHFTGNFNIDLDKTIYLFSAGRYEFTNKGVDMLLESLAQLNGYLKWNNIDLTVIVFLVFPTGSGNFNVESLRGQALYKQLKESVNTLKDKVGDRILDRLLRGVLDFSDIVKKEDIIQLKRYSIASKNNQWPPICTHNVHDDATDPILSNLRRLNLVNNPNDKVKVIFHPEFLNITNPLFPIEYEEFVSGCNLGVFCSYYEPWGYTPAECTIMGIPSVSSNLSGFGQYMGGLIPHPKDFGIYIVDRRHCSAGESINQLTEYLLHFCMQTRRQRIIQRNRTERLSELLDWKVLINHYKKAYQLALHRAYPGKHKPAGKESDDELTLESQISSELRRTLSLPESGTSVVDLFGENDNE